MPFQLRNSAIVNTPSGQGIILIGGYNGSYRQYSNALLELKGNSEEWIHLEQKLQFPREQHVAFHIPEELTSCKITYCKKK